MSDDTYWKEIARECAEEGICVRCRKRLAEPFRVKCKGCADYQSAYMKKRRAENMSRGLCRCGRPKDDETKYRCIICQDAITKMKRKKYGRNL